MTPTPVERSRVLEIGCAAGGNLLPLAGAFPESEFVGIDFSRVEIEEGLADLRALGLRNLQLRCLDIMDFGEEFGTFDYIIAHGVYSWIPERVQDKLLAICARHLAPMGIAYISYNTLPGWRLRSVVRDAMRYHAGKIADPKSRIEQARSVLNFLAESVPGSDASAYGKTLALEAANLQKQPDFYILHEHLEAVNEPIYFYEFAEHAARHGLGYLGEANFSTMLGTEFSPKVLETLNRVAPDVVRREQFMDFLRARAFRESLLVHDSVALTRKISPLRVMELHIAAQARPVAANSDLRSNAAEEFRTPEGTRLSVAGQINKATLVELAEQWPLAIAFDDLCARSLARIGTPGRPTEDTRRYLASEFLQLYAQRIVEMHFARSPFVVQPGEHPEGSAVARLQAQRGLRVTNLRHELGSFNEETRQLFLHLDGTRTRKELATRLWKGVPEAEALRELDAALERLSRLALIVR
jgi:methyltransferase-like protein